MPEERLWSQRSERLIHRILAMSDPDHPDRVVVNLGAGVESVFARLFAPYRSLLRIGLPHAGRVDAYGDAHALPLLNASIDLFLSSSVMEHLEDPERAIAEMARVLREGGHVYAEIPFLRAYHMAPADYQRYTVTGIETLFARHGFELVEKGICSGPFTAWALLVRDFAFVITPTRPLKVAVRLLLSWLVQPIKYLDRFCEEASWAVYHACNFYYLGKKAR